MKINKDNHRDVQKLRRLAEKRLLARDVELANMSSKDINELIHELEVHQLELEMQNEQLRQAQTELEAAAAFLETRLETAVRYGFH